jgi:hypothetical protein
MVEFPRTLFVDNTERGSKISNPALRSLKLVVVVVAPREPRPPFLGKDRSFNAYITRTNNLKLHIYDKTTPTSSTLVVITHMHLFPTQPPLTGKRKLDDSNPLLNAAAAKRAKKEVFCCLL